ncbi:MAG: substrate-binding domain-containing protein, partial [Cetobacterium sp.]
NLSVELFKNFSPEGIITTDDVLAYGVEEYLNKNSLKDIHLFGFNNNPLGEFLRHPLNTVEIHGEILGHEAIDLLIKKLKNEYHENNFIVQSEIILKNLS